MISTIEKVLFLKTIDLFSHIPGEDLAQVARIAQEVHFSNGDLIIHEGDMGDSLFLVVEGEVVVHRDGKLVARLGESEAFGEMAILDNEPRSASVSAAIDVSCLKIERDDFFELMAEKVEIAQGIIRVLTQRLRDATRKLSQPTAP